MHCWFVLCYDLARILTVTDFMYYSCTNQPLNTIYNLDRYILITWRASTVFSRRKLAKCQFYQTKKKSDSTLFFFWPFFFCYANNRNYLGDIMYRFTTRLAEASSMSSCATRYSHSCTIEYSSRWRPSVSSERKVLGSRKHRYSTLNTNKIGQIKATQHTRVLRKQVGLFWL